MKRKLLITLDEARAAVSTSALDLVRNWSLDHERLLASIRGDARLVLPQREAARVSAHRRLVDALRRDGLGWLVEEELEGVCSYAGPICDEASEDWVSPLASGE
jgi:DNA-binding IclR family transcriptional regulator